jgi:hypothetical protein
MGLKPAEYFGAFAWPIDRAEWRTKANDNLVKFDNLSIFE